MPKRKYRFVYCNIIFVLISALFTQIVIFQPQPVNAAASLSYHYTKTFDTTDGYAYGRSVTTDAHGDIYVTGSFFGTVVFDGLGGSDSQTTTSESGDTFLTKYNPNGSYGWTKTFDATNGDAAGESLTTDIQGNIYVTGYFSNTVIFDGLGGSDSHTAPDNNTGSYVAKYNSNGSYGWTKIVDTTDGYAYSSGVTVDSNGDIYVVGYFYRTVIFDGSGGNDSQIATNGNYFLTKYNPDGSYGWTKTFDTTNGFADGSGIVIDSQRNIYVTGSFYDTVIFDGSGGSDSQTAPNSDYSFFITKYNPDGSYGWTKIADSTNGYVDSRGIAVDSQNNVYITGGFMDTIVFDGVGGVDSQTTFSEMGGNSFLTKYNSDGSYGWTKIIYTTDGFSIGSGVTVDIHDDVYVAGYYANTVIFDGPGGSDSRTTVNDSSFLTSYQIPSSVEPAQPGSTPNTTKTNPVSNTILTDSASGDTTSSYATSPTDSTEQTTPTIPSENNPELQEIPKNTTEPNYMWWYIGGGSGLLVLFLLVIWRRVVK